MTEFPELLNKFIEQKNIHIYSMAKYCGLDRSTLYKIIKGNRRPPSASVRDKMACFMHLTPDETRQFEQAWEISFTGKLTYCRRKSTEDFLLNFPKSCLLTVPALLFLKKTAFRPIFMQC